MTFHSRTTIRSGVLDSLTEESSKISSRKSIGASASAEAFAQNHELLAGISSLVPASTVDGYASLVNFAPSSDKPVHRWFWYREGYSEELVKEFIRDLPRGSTVLDPFCGAGTSLMAAQVKGLPAIGFDVNPISVLVSRVKLRRISQSEEGELQQAIRRLEAVTSNDSADPKPELKVIDRIFDSGVLHALLVLRRSIKAEKVTAVRELLFVAWLSILEGVSNVYKEGNGVKYKNRKRTDKGYIRVDLKAWQDASLPRDRFRFVRERLLERVTVMCDDMKHVSNSSQSFRLIEDTALNVGKHLEPNSVSLVIFSPPYCNCFNYFKMYKVELWMGEFVKSYEEIRALNRRGLRSHVETILKRDSDSEEPYSEAFAKQLDGVQLWDKRIPSAVRGYFIDMKQVLRELYTVMKPSARCAMVVGNSAYGGLVVPTDALLAQIAAGLGFKVEKLAVARSLTTSSQQRQYLAGREEYLRESILVVSKPDPRLADKPLEVVDEIPCTDAKRRDKVFLIRNNSLTVGTHKFHRYPGKFIPHVPRWAIQRYGTHTSVLVDPFCGSGTTLVEATRAKLRSFGIDVDPIARLVSKAKTTHIPSDSLRALVSEVGAKVRSKKRGQFRPTIPTLNHWFTDDAINRLGIIRDVIEQYNTKPKVYRFLLVCFAAVIRRASNADNQTQKTYVSHTKPKTPEDAVVLFLRVLADYAERASTLPKRTLASVLDNCSALSFGDYWLRTELPSVDLIVASPPYLNSVDYVYNQMAEYFWIGDLFDMHNQDLQNEYKRKYIGTAAIPKAVYEEIPSLGIPAVDTAVRAIQRKSQKNAYIVAKYFFDMRKHMEQSRRVLKPGGTYVMVIGDSLLSGEPVPVADIMSDVFEEAGFSLRGRFGYEIRNRHMRFPRMGRGGILRYDWVLELERG